MKADEDEYKRKTIISPIFKTVLHEIKRNNTCMKEHTNMFLKAFMSAFINAWSNFTMQRDFSGSESM